MTDRRVHWVVAEAIGAAAALHEATVEDVYEIWYRRIWDFTVQHLIDRIGGGWRHELDARLAPAARG